MLNDDGLCNACEQPKAAHTPTPWRVKTVHQEFENEDEGVICEIGSIQIVSEEAINEREAAHKIVDCVNACAGINPEAVPDLLEACEHFIKLTNTEQFATVTEGWDSDDCFCNLALALDKVKKRA